MSCIKVCPNVCECVAIICRKNVYTIMGESTKLALGVSLMFQFLVS
jgi:hypothetical protein